MKNFFAALPVRLVLALCGAALANMVVCNRTVALFFTVSSLIKELLEVCLPFIVFFFVSAGIASFARQSVAMIAVLIGAVTFSNAATALYSYGAGQLLLAALPAQHVEVLALPAAGITPLWSFGLRSFISSEVAMLAALALGCVLAFASLPLVARLVSAGKRRIEVGLTRFFIPLLPLYIFGFFLKMMRELPVARLCGAYGVIFVSVVVLQMLWLAFAYVVANRFSWRAAARSAGAAAPSYLTALGTMSSVATLPVSLVCAEKNTHNPVLAQFAMPILANIHLMGDAVSVPIFALATMQLFSGAMPSFITYLIFSGYLCLTMLAVSGIPGGGIIVMLPLLKSLFGFTPEMLSVITALYLLQDGFGTAANVMGDGALVIVLNRIGGFFMKGMQQYGGARKR